MAIVFAVRCDSINARYSTGYPEGALHGSTTQGADVGALSGGLIAGSTVGGSFVSWCGYRNAGESRAFSVVIRLKSLYTGSPAASRSIFSLGQTNSSHTGPHLQVWHGTDGQITVNCRNEANTLCFNQADIGAFSPTANTYYDHVFTWDGDTTTNGCTYYIDASSIGSITAAAALSASWSSTYFGSIHVGNSSLATASDASLDEFVIYNSVIDPTSVSLVSGTGSLNGASRTSLIDVASYDGSSAGGSTDYLILGP